MLVAIPAAIGLFAALSWVLEGPGLGQGLGRVHLLVELAIVAALAGAWTTRGRLGQVLSALTRVDPFALPHVLWFGLLYFALRAPLIFSGSYGTDRDAWRLARSAFVLWSEGAYGRSRPPGNPLVEVGLAPFVGLGGPVAANLASALLGLVALWCLHRIMQELGLRLAGLATLGVAMAPLFVVHTANSMDYAWALAPIFGCALCVVRGRWPLAAALAAVALGARLGSAGPLAGIAIFGLLRRRPDPWTLLTTTLSFVATLGLVYAPVLDTYGLRFLRHAEPNWTLPQVHLSVQNAFGVLPVVVGGLAIGDLLRRAWTREAGSPMLDARVLGLAGAVGVVGMFAYLPLQSGYLLPLLPFLAVLLATWVTPATAVAMVAAVGLSGFVEMKNVKGRARGALVAEVERVDRTAATFELLRALDAPEGAVVIVGDATPYLRLARGHHTEAAEAQWGSGARYDPERNVVFATIPTPDALVGALADGRLLLLTSDRAGKVVGRRTKLDLDSLGAQLVAAR